LKLEQEAHDKQYGRGGIPELKRPRWVKKKNI
jgi:hypothetical protein